MIEQGNFDTSQNRICDKKPILTDTCFSLRRGIILLGRAQYNIRIYLLHFRHMKTLSRISKYSLSHSNCGESALVGSLSKGGEINRKERS